MNCPCCDGNLDVITYEGIRIESCPDCQGEWLDGAELKHVIEARERKFSPEERKAIAVAKRIKGVRMEDADRDLNCPKCAGKTDAMNYGGDTGIIIDRCTTCGGFWLDNSEIENVQMLVETWEDELPADLKKYAPRLRQIEVDVDQRDDVHPSNLPYVGKFINTIINGILDVLDQR